MSDELRMELADCGSPEGLIATILKHHPEWSVPVPVEELAHEVGIVEFVELEADTFEGALETNVEKSRGVILTRAGAREPRRRFTVAHELGHFLMPSHRGDERCTSQDLQERRLDAGPRRQEAEANRFAAGLLMPERWFTSDIDRLGSAELMHVQEMAKNYRTSLEATVNRYADLTNDACAFVLSKDRVIRYIRRSKNFPRLAVRRGDMLPDGCSSLRAAPSPLRVATSWEELYGSTWLEAPSGEPGTSVLEQSVRQSEGFQVTLLFIEPADASEDEDESELEESYVPRFRGK